MIICTRYTPDHEGAAYGSADLFLEEYGLLIHDVRIATATVPSQKDAPAPVAGQNDVMQLPRCIVVVEGIPTTRDMLTIPRSGDKLVFFAQAVRAIDRYNERAAEALRVRQENAPRVPGNREVN